YCGGPEIVLQSAYLDDVTKEEVRHNCRRGQRQRQGLGIARSAGAIRIVGVAEDYRVMRVRAKPIAATLR
ncbi:MAG: hypothetical protein DMG18_01725, partial [Acidobacteria bacterium]